MRAQGSSSLQDCDRTQAGVFISFVTLAVMQDGDSKRKGKSRTGKSFRKPQQFKGGASDALTLVEEGWVMWVEGRGEG